MSADWLELTACEQGRAIKRGEINPVDLAEAYFEKIEASDVAPNIYARLTKDRAFAEAGAASARAKAGRSNSPLDGVPVSWKDLFDTAEVATEAGSRLLKGRVPAADAAVLRNASHAGMVCLGKTHMSELAFSGLGINPFTGTPPCINDGDSVSGGSSSGAAASVAFGLAAAAVGSDTGGSVRGPAAWNDLVGLKTTLGLIPLDGSVLLCPSFDTVGPLTCCVEDAAAMLAALTGGKRRIDLKGATVERMRILTLENVVMEGLEAPCAEGFKRSVELMESCGAEVTSKSVPAVDEALLLATPLYCVEAYSIWMETIEAAPELMFPEIRDRFRSGKTFSGTDYAQAQQKLAALREEFKEAVSGYDAIAMPTSPILPPKKKRLLSDSEYYAERNLIALRNTRIANLMEVPALTLPTGVASAGVMLFAQPFEEAKLLRIGRALEAKLG